MLCGGGNPSFGPWYVFALNCFVALNELSLTIYLSVVKVIADHTYLTGSGAVYLRMLLGPVTNASTRWSQGHGGDVCPYLQE